MTPTKKEQEEFDKLHEEVSELKSLLNDAGVAAFFFTLFSGLFVFWSSGESLFTKFIGVLLIILSVVELIYFRRN